ncbi:MAG: EamA family transporter [Thaumarchaeota archaeon]|nr:EamA family transporter [Nitrososphaerota archaeon]
MNPNRERLVLPAFVTTVLIGGTNFVAVKFSNSELPPFWGAALRFSSASVILFLIIFARRLDLPRGRALTGAAIYGFLSFGLSYAFAYYALVSLTAGFAAVVLGLVPLATLFLARAHKQEKISFRGLVGGLAALVGTAVIYNEQLGLVENVLPLLALIGAVTCIAETNVVLKAFPRTNPYSTNAVAMLIGSAILFALSAASGEAFSIPSNLSTIIAVSYLVVVGSVVLFLLFLFVISRWTASSTSYQLVLNPLVTVLEASFLRGEVVTTVFIAGSALVLLGVYFGALSSRRTRGPAQLAGAPREIRQIL